MQYYYFQRNLFKTQPKVDMTPHHGIVNTSGFGNGICPALTRRLTDQYEKSRL